MHSSDRAFDEIASEWNANRDSPSPVLSLLMQYALPMQTALDAGCGNGRNSIQLAQRFRSVLAFDSSPKMVQATQAKMASAGLEQRVKAIEGNVCSMPCENNAANAVFALAVLHHLQTPELRQKAFCEAQRVLKPGGRLFLAVWNKLQPRFAKKEGNEVVLKSFAGKAAQRYHYFFDENEFRQLAQNAGLTEFKVFYEKNGLLNHAQGAHNLCAVFEKPRKHLKP